MVIDINRLKIILYNSFVMLSDENFLAIELGLSQEEIKELKQAEDFKDIIVGD